jgi:polysaccharide deacetylase family protein (PEP-CTERM system associated)
MKILTFDIEDWFHILDNKSTKTEKEWGNFKPRIHENMDRIFQILEKNNTKASFFVLGWIAEKYPEVVKEIKERGYEIGSHTHLHQLVYNQNRNEFYQDVDRSIKTLQDISGDHVKMFRAPGFSIKENNKWAFEVLYDLGIRIDSSVVPAGRSHGGMPSYASSKPSLLNYNGITIKEFPINTHKILSKSFIYSGGGYFRLLPYTFIKKFSNESEYIMSYFHPRDFDYKQPMIEDLPIFRKFKSYVGLKSSTNKLNNWLFDFDFSDISQADNKICWDNVKKINL